MSVSFDLFKQTCHEFIESHLAQKQLRKQLKAVRDANNEREQVIQTFLKENQMPHDEASNDRKLTLQMPALHFNATFVLKENTKKPPVNKVSVSDAIRTLVDDSELAENVIQSIYDKDDSSKILKLSVKTKLI